MVLLKVHHALRSDEIKYNYLEILMAFYVLILKCDES